MTPTIAVRASDTQAHPVKVEANHYLPRMAIFGQKNCALVFGGVETSMKLIFHLPRADPTFSSKSTQLTFQNPPFIFPL